MLFFLYFFIFSCFSKAREAVKRTSEIKFSYIELTYWLHWFHFLRLYLQDFFLTQILSITQIGEPQATLLETVGWGFGYAELKVQQETHLCNLNASSL